MPILAAARRRLARLLPAGRGGVDEGEGSLPLDTVRRRLEILLTAVYGRAIPIVDAAPPEAEPWYRRAFRRPPAHLYGEAPRAASDGERIHLPASLPLDGAGPDAALARYRLLAFEQAERLVRGTAALAPQDDPLARDLYLLAEGAAVDASLPATAPGLRPALAAERAAALRGRPDLDRLTGAEREVETMVRAALAGPPAEAPRNATPAESLAWARTQAARLREAGGRYRGLPPVASWGTVLPLAPGARPPEPLDPAAPSSPEIVPIRGIDRVRRKGAAGRSGEDAEARSAAEEGGEGERAGEEVARDGAGEPLEEGPEADAGGEGVPAGDLPRKAREGSRPPPEGPDSQATGIEYPEWDWKAGRYRPRGAVVREAVPVEGDEAWSLAVLAGHGGLVRRLREQFEKLRARRARLYRQPAGDEIDLDACVRALVEQRAGHAVDDRLYAAVRPARREISILLLVDISGSTDGIVGNTRIIDIEKTALLLTAQALDALGDRYAVLTFSGEGASNVRVRTVKGFADRDGAALRRRVAALRPEGFTRMGTAIRHAIALLGAQRTAHQLLLILSDGKPNDSDHYEGRFGIEDSRQAIAEARAAGVHPFCLTVDRKGSEYLTRIFGETGHRVLRQAEQLPHALLGVVRHLLRG